MSIKRLFLVAAYDRMGHVDASLEYYVRELSQYGDVIVHMDNDCDDGSIKKLAPFTIAETAARHGEYDFGSYKRAYMYASFAGILSDYDFVYLANDSVYGPLADIGPILNEMESLDVDAFGPVCNPNPAHPHIQSWFIGMRATVFLAPWFKKFIQSVRKQTDKGSVTKLYEQGFTALVSKHGLAWGCIYTVENRGIYNQIKKLYRGGLPFMKKVAFSRHGGRLGRQILYVLNHIAPDARASILENARRTWGAEYIDWLLTNNPVKILMRGVKYALGKARKGQI